jgi:hypothetical protein
MSAVGEKKYLVRFDNGVERECPSNSLSMENMHESLPPDVVPPPHLTNQEHIKEEQLDEAQALADQDEEEPLDVEEDEDAIEEEEEEEEESGDGLASGMPGQLPTEKEQPKDYTAIKKLAKEKIAAMVGQEVTVSSKSSGAITWKVIASLDPPVIIPESEPMVKYGLKDFNLGQ